MATAGVSNEHELHEITQLLWGPDINSDIFKRWSQGFHFSDDEKSALVQDDGGPCAVIAPVQGFIIKNLLLESEGVCFIGSVAEDRNVRILVKSMCEILNQCSGTNFRIVYYKASNAESPETAKQEPQITSRTSSLHPLEFHQNLETTVYNTIEEVEQHYMRKYEAVISHYGVLLFLYSVMLTKGIEQIKIELSDISEPLIHETYGYGGQGLINLMLTGRAVAHVWDNEQDVGGLKLRGIDRQSEIGFVTLMEHMRYCTVGSFYKNPKHPVWVLGSETHLTVLFSDERRLVSPETPSEKARRIFKSYDPDGNNFISTALLQDVLHALDLVSDTEYVDIMKKRLDSENLGIILLNAFMEEFFPKEESSTPDTFTLFHYNGLARSNLDGKVKYNTGIAVLLECDIKSICESNPMLTCLQTKWPSIEVNWAIGRSPSLN